MSSLHIHNTIISQHLPTCIYVSDYRASGYSMEFGTVTLNGGQKVDADTIVIVSSDIQLFWWLKYLTSYICSKYLYKYLSVFLQSLFFCCIEMHVEVT